MEFSYVSADSWSERGITWNNKPSSSTVLGTVTGFVTGQSFDIDVTAKFKAIAGATDQGGGPVWRFQDGNNYYVARMNPLEDNFRFYKVVAGKRTELAGRLQQRYGYAKDEAEKNIDTWLKTTN